MACLLLASSRPECIFLLAISDGSIGGRLLVAVLAILSTIFVSRVTEWWLVKEKLKTLKKAQLLMYTSWGGGGGGEGKILRGREKEKGKGKGRGKGGDWGGGGHNFSKIACAVTVYKRKKSKCLCSEK